MRSFKDCLARVLMLAVLFLQCKAFLILNSKALPLFTRRKAKCSLNTANPTGQDWDTERYQTQHSFVYEYGKSLIDLVQAAPGETVLDVGCGTGVLTAALVDRYDGVRAIGMDADPKMVLEARAKFPHVEFRQGDMRDFRLDPPVDVLLSNAAIHWIPCGDQMDQAILCMADSLKPGGRFLVELGGKGNVEKIVGALQQVLLQRHGVHFECPWCFPSIAMFTTILEKYGIEALSVELYDRPTLLEDGENGVSNWIRMFTGHLVGSYLDRETLAEVNDILRSDLFDGEKWIADYRRLRVIGRKV